MENEIGKRLKALRARAGLTQRELAAALDMEHASYAYYESARYKSGHLPNRLIAGLMKVLLRRGEPPIMADDIGDMAEPLPAPPGRAAAPAEDLPSDPRALMDELNNIDRQTTHALRAWLARQPDAPPEIVRLHVQATTCRQMIVRSFS